MGWRLTAESWGFIVEADDELKRTFARQVEDRVLDGYLRIGMVSEQPSCTRRSG